ncbi:unnamed protein product [Sphagnum troendelagicum]|uniref:Dolichyl-diphosphooligosaccharide--protein glycosyltransferase 48 kDa subunit n=1 Tax=Sphagnum troendelagicum TaxID=128251 RepID=A0ABP0UNC9_9BRYO
MASREIWLVFLTVSLLPLVCFGFSEEQPSDRRVLALLEDVSIKETHSIFFKSLADRGFEVDFKLAEDPDLSLQKYGVYLYDALVLFAPSVEALGGGGALDVAAVLDFVDSGHDLILAAGTKTSNFVRDIATECGADFEEEVDAVVIDHTQFAITPGENDHSVIAADSFVDAPTILGSEHIPAPVLFRGIAHSVNIANDLMVTVLSASPAAFSGKPNTDLTEAPTLTGTSVTLVSAIQARNNARILISGSLDLFSNKFFRLSFQRSSNGLRYAKSGNEQFAVELSKWTFHERGHLKAINLQHHKSGGSGDEPSMYRITDHLEFSLEIYEWTGREWVPYQADDVQVQFYMMSPYIRKTLSHDGNGLYYTAFQVPDVYGVFQFKVEYQRLGYTTLSLSKQIPVRPFRHNEYERFIPAAFPYYGSAFSSMLAFFVFGLVFLYHK